MGDEPRPAALDHSQTFPIVGIGASAGGLEAISQFLRGLPLDTGIGFVVVQHLAPNYDSMLAELLGRTTAIPVVEATAGRAVEPNHVYVIPPGFDLEIVHGVLKLSPRATGSALHMPVDQFLISLAEDAKSKAIGIILSGSASDGTLGLKAVKAAGGITFAQEEATARYGSMPHQAIASGCVDFILPPEKIGQELLRIKQHAYVALEIVGVEGDRGELTEAEFSTIFGVLKSATGVDFSNYKEPTVVRRVRRRMALHNISAVSAYIEYLQQTPGEPQALYNDLLISVTSFFRDSEIFDLLKREVFPHLTDDGSVRDPMRIWVPGCSTGEEAYSVAISVLEYFSGIKSSASVQIFATDISEVALEAARAGSYTTSEVAEVSSERLKRFFTKAPHGYQINKTIRDLCVFARQNLIKDPPFSRLDLICCRNLLIYLKPNLHRRLMPVFHYALQPHGFLVLGRSENATGVSDLFGIVDRKNKVYFKKPAPAGSRPDFGANERFAAIPDSRNRIAMRTAKDFDPRKEADRLLLSDYTPAAVLLNGNLEIIQFHGHTGPFLDPATGAASLRLLKMAREGLPMELRSAIQKVEADGKTVIKSGIRVATGDQIREMTIEVRQLKSPDDDRYFLVLFRETGMLVPSESIPHSEEDREALSLKRELEQLNAQLQEIIEQNEENEQELRAANEEVQSTNEEFQSTNEELETAKEELQASNEELTTLNEELQTRNLELGRANSDLMNVIENVHVPMVILGSDLRIRRFTASAENVLSLIPADVGRPITDLRSALEFEDLGEMVSDAIRSETMKSRDVKDRHGKWHSLRVRPYRASGDKIEGAVMSLIDIDELKSEVAEVHKYAEAIVSTSREPILVLDVGLRVKALNDAFLKMFEVSREETEGRKVYELGSGEWNNPELLRLLREILPKKTEIKDFDVVYDFPKLGSRIMRLNASQVKRSENRPGWILLAFEDVTGSRQSRSA
jgi:two-component system, chemotaxis family, CheB/CheR fusion protein